MGSGKSTVANYLSGYWGYATVPLAKPMRDMMMAFLRSFNYSPIEIGDFLSVNKETPISRIPGKPTARQLLQHLGTEWGRNCVHDQVWIAAWQAAALNCKYIVTDDCRFLNEYKTIKSIPGAQVWRITRQSAKVTSAHSSEGELDNVAVDHELTNDGTVAELHAKIDAILEGCLADRTLLEALDAYPKDRLPSYILRLS
jgi:hypothetical protein